MRAIANNGDVLIVSDESWTIDDTITAAGTQWVCDRIAGDDAHFILADPRKPNTEALPSVRAALEAAAARTAEVLNQGTRRVQATTGELPTADVTDGEAR